MVHNNPDIDKAPVRLWFTPTVGQVDLKEARKIIVAAKQANLFLMFNPGPKNTLLNQIIETARPARPANACIFEERSIKTRAQRPIRWNSLKFEIPRRPTSTSCCPRPSTRPQAGSVEK